MSFLVAGDFLCLDVGRGGAAGAAVVDVLRRLLACAEPVRAAAAVVLRRVVGGIASEKELAGLSKKKSFSSRESKTGSDAWDSPVELLAEESWVAVRSGPKGWRMQLVDDNSRGAAVAVVFVVALVDAAVLRNARCGVEA